MSRWFQRLAALALTLVMVQAGSAQQPAARGTITGQVILAENGAPAVSAQVHIVGTSMGALTGTDGRFTLLNVPAGPRTVHVRVPEPVAVDAVWSDALPDGGVSARAVLLATHRERLQSALDTLGRELDPLEARFAIENPLHRG